jgi:hypothetical protein
MEMELTLTYLVTTLSKPTRPGFPGGTTSEFLFTLPEKVRMKLKEEPKPGNIQLEAYEPPIFKRTGFHVFSLVHVVAEKVRP